MLRWVLAAVPELPGVRFHSVFGRACPSLSAPPILAANTRVDEERLPGYDAHNFYPVQLGDVFNQRYEVITKLGFGAKSTVWLARDTTCWFWQAHQYVALKVGTSPSFDPMLKASFQRELEVSKRIRYNSEDPNAALLRPGLDHFELRREDGIGHQCITHALLRESLWGFQHRFKEERLPTGLLKAYAVLMLKALDFLHTKCKYIHGDLKDDNFLVTFENPSIVHKFVEKLASNPQAQKVVGDRTIYHSHVDFGAFESFDVGLRLIDFDKSQPGDHSGPLRYPMQAAVYRTPEVLMGLPWSYSLDIWNFGALMWNLMENRDLFEPITTDGKYDARVHIAQMIALLGHPPLEFLESERKWRDVPWCQPCPNDAGHECFFPREFWGGPFFNDDGRFLHEQMIPTELNLSNTVQSLDGEDKAQFVDFARQILKWVPEQRKTAKELLEHPWLDLKAERRRLEMEQNREERSTVD